MSNPEFNKSEVFNFAESVEYATGAIVSKTVLKKRTGNISLFAFDKGQELSEHTAKFDAVIQVLDGKAEISISRNPFVLAIGETIILPANIPHEVRAVEKFKMLLTMIKDEAESVKYKL
jgi:quercetin dioxygenase-like cupin family protein